MEELVGKKFQIHTTGVRTVTSMNDDGYEQWYVDSVKEDGTLYCELKSTNMSMYSGGGYFKPFTVDQVKKYLNIK